MKKEISKKVIFIN